MFWLPVQDRARPGSRSRSICRADPGRAPHQPVLDARQRHLRPAAGQAAVRLHRRRRDPRRRGRQRAARVAAPHDRHQQPPAAGAAVLLGVCAVVVSADRRREKRRRRVAHSPARKRRASARAKRCSCCAVVAPANHRARDRLRGDRRGDLSSSSSTWRPRRAKGAGATDSLTAFLGTGQLLDVDHRLRRSRSG